MAHSQGCQVEDSPAGHWRDRQELGDRRRTEQEEEESEEREGSRQGCREHWASFPPQLVVGSEEPQSVVRGRDLLVELEDRHQEGQEAAGTCQPPPVSPGFVLRHQ